MEWVLGHMEDADFNEPLPDSSAAAPPGPASTSAPASEAAADPESVMMLASMGFTDVQAAAALKVSPSLLQCLGWTELSGLVQPLAPVCCSRLLKCVAAIVIICCSCCHQSVAAVVVSLLQPLFGSVCGSLAVYSLIFGDLVLHMVFDAVQWG